jgi:hypothetical protein
MSGPPKSHDHPSNRFSLELKAPPYVVHSRPKLSDPLPHSLFFAWQPNWLQPLKWIQWLPVIIAWTKPCERPVLAHIKPLEGRIKRKICWAKVRNHISKRVFECLILRNHSIIVIIFSLIDFKKRLRRRDTAKMFHLSTAQDKLKNYTKAPWGK